MKAVIAGLAMTVGFSAFANAQSIPEWSIWRNPRASLLIITTVDTAAGTFAGTFINNAKGYKCQGFGVPIKGKVNGREISFVANFAPCANTITAWKGTFGDTAITTNWKLWSADDNGDFKELKNEDVFTRIN
jgi:hypothetical protein